MLRACKSAIRLPFFPPLVTEQLTLCRNQRLTLESLSKTAGEEMGDDSTFGVFRHYFAGKAAEEGEPNGFFLGQEASSYADALLSDAFNRNETDSIGEKILVHSVWMSVMHELHETIRGCLDDSAVESAAALDRAAAFWLGTGAESSNDNTFNTLYDLTEVGATTFNQDSVNLRIVESLNDLQRKIATEGKCSDNSQATLVRKDILGLMDLMKVPIVQNLFDAVLGSDDFERINTYRLAAAPLLHACNGEFAEQIDLADLTSLSESEKLDWAETLISSFSCFGLSCDDVGSYESNLQLDCNENDVLMIGDYQAFNSRARLDSFIDRDFVEIQILLEVQSYKAALELYEYGHHAPFSMYDLATNRLVPKPAKSFFDLYKNYYDDKTYDFIDVTVRRALSRQEEFQNASPKKIYEIITGILKYEAIVLTVQSAFEAATEQCQLETPESVDAVREYWDVGAALYIGSISGGTLGGQDYGQLLFSTSNALCPLFDTCFNGNSKTNNLIMQVLQNGRDSIVQEDCEVMAKLVQENILPSLEVILLQGTVANTAITGQLNFDSDDERLGTTYAFSRAILPLINEANRESAVVIEQNLRVGNEKPTTVDTPFDIINALQLALDDMEANCQDVGTLQSLTLSFCSPAYLQHPANRIAFGKYIFSDRTAALSMASISLDIQEILSAESLETAKHYLQRRAQCFQYKCAGQWSNVNCIFQHRIYQHHERGPSIQHIHVCHVRR